MKTKPQFTRRLLSILLCMAMLLACVPTAVFAAEGDSVCTCQTKCAEGSVNTECAVCSADLTACIAAAAATLPRYLYVGGVAVVEEYTVSAVTSGEGWRYDTATATLYLTDGADIRYTSTTEECLENGLYCSNGTLKVHASGTVSITGYADGIRLPDGTLELCAAEGSNITITGTSAGSEGISSTVNTNSIRISGKGTVNVNASDDASYGMTAAGSIYIDGVTLNVRGTSNYDDISGANVLIGQTEGAVVNCLGTTCSGIGGTLTQKVGIYNGSIVHLAEKTTEKSWLLGFHAKTIEIADSTVVMDGLTGAYSIYAMHGASTVSGASHILIRKMVSTEDGAYGLTVGYDPYQLTGEAGYYTRSDATAEFTADGDITEIYIGYFELYYPSHMSYHSNGDGTHYYGCPTACPAAIKGENEECSGTVTCAEPVVCESCGAVRQLPHSYDNEADTDCNACGALRYDIWVAGVRVTEENASDVLGDGTVSYDGAANTLTLNGATVDASALAVPALEVSGESLTLVLQGTNALTGSAQVLSSVDEAGNATWYGEPAISIAGGTVLTVTGDETATLTLLGNDFAYTANDHIPSASSISGGSLNVVGGTITTNNGIRLSGDYSQTGGSVEAGFLEAQNVTVSDGILNAKGDSGICPKYVDSLAGGIHGIFANQAINISGGNVTTESGVVGHNGDYCGNMKVTGETITTHGLYALEFVSITGGTVTSTGCWGGYVIDVFGFLALGRYTEDDVTPSGPAPGSALEAPDWSISEEATFICGSETSHRGGTADCSDKATCHFCGASYGETDTTNHNTVNAQYTNGFCDGCGIYEAPELVDDVYQIGNAGQLYWFAQQVNSGKPYINAVLTADITINKNVLIDGELNPDTTVVNGFRTWTPIGKGTDHYYYGSFDGQNHSISGLYYQGGDFYVGLFGYLTYGAVVKNLTLTDSYFNVDASGTSHFYAGGIAASLIRGRIENCRNEANLCVNYDYNADVGGIVGFVSTNGTVSHCRNSGKLHGGNTDILSIGGIVGNAVGVITDCGNTGDIIVDNGVNTVVGGVSNGGTLENCFNTGSFDITSTVFYPGGISGRSATVTNCYYLMGVADEGIEGEDSEGAIQAMSQEAFASGEVAYLLNGGVTDGTQSWYQTIGTDATPELSGDTVYYGYTGCMDRTIGYGNDAIYETTPDHVYSDDGFCLNGCYQPAELITEENYTALGVDASYVGAYAISNAGQLYWYAALTNGMLSDIPMDYYASGVLLADLDLEGRDWIPIGLYQETIDGVYLDTCWGSDNVWDNVNRRYTSYFDGRGHTISNFNAVGENSQGLFGYIYCASIMNLTVKNATASGWNAGAIAGYPYGCFIENCSAIGCTISGETATADSPYSIVGAMTGSFYGYLYNSFAYDCTVLRARAEDYLYALGGLEDDGYAYNSVYSKVRYGYVGDETLTEFYYGLCMTEEDMASGYVAYWLSQGYSDENYAVSGDIWGQALGTDACPVLGGPAVYQVLNCDGVTEIFSNTNENKSHDYNEYGYCIGCEVECVHTPDETTGNCAVCGNFIIAKGVGSVQCQEGEESESGYEEGYRSGILYFVDINKTLNRGCSELYLYGDAYYSGEYTLTDVTHMLDPQVKLYLNGHTLTLAEGWGVYVGYDLEIIDGTLAGSYDGALLRPYSGTYELILNGVTLVNEQGYALSNGYEYGGSWKITLQGGSVLQGAVADVYYNAAEQGRLIFGDSYTGDSISFALAPEITAEDFVLATAAEGVTLDRSWMADNDTTDTLYVLRDAENNQLYLGACVESTHEWGWVQLETTHERTCSICGLYESADHADEVADHFCDTCGKQLSDHEVQAEVNWYLHVESCYVNLTASCPGCDITVYDSGNATLTASYEGTNCQDPSTVTYSFTYTFDGTEYTVTETLKTGTDPHIAFDVNGFCTVCGGYQAAVWNEEKSVYEISNAGQLYWYAQYLNTTNAEIYAELTADIVIPENAPNWEPINASYAYFNGNYHTISGLKCIGDEDMTYVGLFGMEGWWYEISNLHITDSYFEGSDYVGAVVACMTNGGSITNCAVTGTTVKGDGDYVGTLAGYLTMGSVINCFVDTNNLVGGYSNGYATIENSYYLSETETEDGGKTAAQFASGEVAYLLQSGVAEEDIYDEDWNWIGSYIPEVWGQTIGSDSYPVLKGAKVYEVTNCKDEVAYSNTDVSGQHADADNSGRCDNCSTLMQPAKLCFATISMEGNIAINYYMLLSDEVLADETAYMQFTLTDGTIIEVSVTEGVKTDRDGETYYVFSCAVNAKEMTDDVLCQFFYEGGSTAEYTYSVRTYAKQILANSNNDAAKNLVAAMLNYGAAAQMNFGYNTDNLANADLEAPDYSSVSIDGFTSVSGQGTELATFHAASLILKSETTLRFFFTGSITATYNGQELEVKERNGLYYVDVVGIAAKDLDEDVTITINDGTNTADVTYNPMAYCTVVQKDTTGAANQTMKDLVAALYLYNQAANAYFEEN